MIIPSILYLLLFIPFSDGLNNGLGLTPQMGEIRRFHWER